MQKYLILTNRPMNLNNSFSANNRNRATSWLLPVKMNVARISRNKASGFLPKWAHVKSGTWSIGRDLLLLELLDSVFALKNGLLSSMIKFRFNKYSKLAKVEKTQNKLSLKNWTNMTQLM